MDSDDGITVFHHSDMTVALQNDQPFPCSSQALDLLWISNSPPPFHGDSGSCSNPMVNFAGEVLLNDHKVEVNEIDNNDDCEFYFHKPEKKRRLKIEQVESLEKIFQVDNKLEPERKLELANELGLQPRQVSIWFQNRRARFKTKQLEKDYCSLKASYDKLQSDHDCLLLKRERLRNQVLQLKQKHTERSVSQPNSQEEPGNKEKSSAAAAAAFKTEDVSAAKSDVVDSESPHCVEGKNHWSWSCSQVEVEESYQVASGEEEEEEENPNNNSVSKKKSVYEEAPCFPKVEEDCDYYSDPSANCCNWDFQVEEQPSSWFWPY